MDLFQKISLAKRDQKTLMLLLLQFRPLIKKYARMLHMEDGIEELVATLLEAIIKCPLRANYRADYFLLSYLKKTIRNRYIYLSKKNESSQCIPFQDKGVVDHPDIEFEDMIKNLSEKQKTVIRLKYAQCYHTEEIAQIMGISRQAVWQLEQRALAKLSLEYDKPEK